MALELNALNVNSFIMDVSRIPILKYHIQEVTFPDVSLGEVKQPTPFQHINQVGDHINHEDFSFTFMIDEKMNNYMAIYHWMKGLAFPECYNDFEKFIKGLHGDENILPAIDPRLAQFSDVTITILSNHKNPILSYKLFDAFPTSLSGFSINVTDVDSVPVTATCTMKFTGFEIVKP